MMFFRIMSSPCEILEAFEDYGLEADNKSLLEALTNICTEYNLFFIILDAGVEFAKSA